MEDRINNMGQVDYLDLQHRYYIVIALSKEAENHLYDCQFYDDKGDIKEGYEGFWFDEKAFLLMEKYFFNFIDSECNLLINMYEEEFAFPEQLPNILEIIDRMSNECDNDKVLKLAKDFRSLVVKAIELNTPVGFCF